jgi:hypothetical protein
MTADSGDLQAAAGAAPVVEQEERDPRRRDRAEDQLIMHLERDQLVAETSRPVPSAALGRRAVMALWALRVFVVVVSAMVIYTFIDQLH